MNGTYRTLIDEAIYIPNDWAEDWERREKCGVPEDVVFKTKAELALKMILHARDNGVPFGWIGWIVSMGSSHCFGMKLPPKE